MATMFVGCKADEDGEGDTDGSKWNLTMTVDATDSAKTELTKKYRRYWKQFSRDEKCAEITTTLTLNLDECILPDGAASVAGFAFDYNKNTKDAKKVDFNLIGVNPKTQKFYVERYTGVSEPGSESLDTDEKAISSNATDLETVAKSSGWCNLTDKMYSRKDNVVTCVVKITQENKKYSVYLGDVKVAEYDASASTYTNTINKKDYAVGGILCYGNAEKGVKLIANYSTNKSDVTGKLMENIDER